MVKKGGEPIEEVYNRKGLSQSDIERVNKLYGCTDEKMRTMSRRYDK